jgi:hypothetical protein
MCSRWSAVQYAEALRHLVRLFAAFGRRQNLKIIVKIRAANVGDDICLFNGVQYEDRSKHLAKHFGDIDGCSGRRLACARAGAATKT